MEHAATCSGRAGQEAAGAGARCSGGSAAASGTDDRTLRCDGRPAPPQQVERTTAPSACALRWRYA
jgi:hypothetical protein